jgi:SAM-dependent methyltransferase
MGFQPTYCTGMPSSTSARLSGPHPDLGAETRTALLSSAYRNDGRPLSPQSSPKAAAWRGYFDALQTGRLKKVVLPCCPVCLAEQRSLIAEKDRFGDAVATVLCHGCGILYTANPLDAESTAQFYQHHYRDLYGGLSPAQAFDLREKSRAIRREQAERLLRRIGFDRQTDVVLEFGCGGGWNLLPFLDLGVRAIGFDYSEDFLAEGRRRGLELYNLASVKPAEVAPRGRLVLYKEVLEHTQDPAAALAELAGHTAEGGYLYLTVPSMDDIAFGASGGRLLGTLQNAHNFLFDRRVLAKLLEQAGYAVDYMDEALITLARKTGSHAAAALRDEAAATRNLALLRRGEHLLQYYWRGLAWLARRLGGSGLARRIVSWHKQALLPADRHGVGRDWGA